MFDGLFVIEGLYIESSEESRSDWYHALTEAGMDNATSISTPYFIDGE